MRPNDPAQDHPLGPWRNKRTTGFGTALAEVSSRVHKASERRRLGADTPRDGPDTEFREYERNAAMNQTTKTIAVIGANGGCEPSAELCGGRTERTQWP